MLDVMSQLASENPWRVSREDYHRMERLGLLGDKRVELLHGVICTMSPIYPLHAFAVDQLNRLFGARIGDRALVRVQNPVVAHDESEPEPDLAIVPPGDYSERHPDRAFLVIEVADTSLRKDRLIKGPLYAESGFPEYWLVNLTEKVVEVHRHPQGDAWRRITRHGRAESLTPGAFPDLMLPIAEFLR